MEPTISRGTQVIPLKGLSSSSRLPHLHFKLTKKAAIPATRELLRSYEITILQSHRHRRGWFGPSYSWNRLKQETRRRVRFLQARRGASSVYYLHVF